MMEKKIILPNIEAVKKFVRESEGLNEQVIVSKEGFNFQIDGASILGMMNVIGERLNVHFGIGSANFLRLLEQFQC